MSTKEAKEYKDVCIQEVEGGYLVHLNGTPYLATSLRKAQSLSKDYLSGEKSEGSDE